MGTAAAPGETGRESGCRHPRAREERTSWPVSARTSADLRPASPPQDHPKVRRRSANFGPRWVPAPSGGYLRHEGEGYAPARRVPVGRPAHAPGEDGTDTPAHDQAGGGWPTSGAERPGADFPPGATGAPTGDRSGSATTRRLIGGATAARRTPRSRRQEAGQGRWFGPCARPSDRIFARPSTRS